MLGRTVPGKAVPGEEVKAILPAWLPPKLRYLPVRYFLALGFRPVITERRSKASRVRCIRFSLLLLS